MYDTRAIKAKNFATLDMDRLEFTLAWANLGISEELLFGKARNLAQSAAVCEQYMDREGARPEASYESFSL